MADQFDFVVSIMYAGQRQMPISTSWLKPLPKLANYMFFRRLLAAQRIGQIIPVAHLDRNKASSEREQRVFPNRIRAATA
jgi:hypothetical protein